MGSKAPPPPPAPDYKALAEEQGRLSREAIEAQTKANRVNQYTPEGSLEWTQDPSGNWTQTVKYSPEQQALYDNMMRVRQGLSDTGLGMLGNVQNAVKDPFSYQGMDEVQDYNFGALPEYGQIDPNEAGFGAVEQVRDAMMARMRPDLDKSRNAEIQRLAAQGLTMGSEPWGGAMEVENRKDVDAQNQALLAATNEYGNIWDRKMQAAQYANQLRGYKLAEQGLGRSASQENRQRQIQEALALRQIPLNELNAFSSGSQVSTPSFGNYNQAGAWDPVDVAGAADKQYQAQMADYNAKQAAKSSKTSGLLSLAGGVAGAFFGMPGIGASIGGALGSKFGPKPAAPAMGTGGAAGYDSGPKLF